MYSTARPSDRQAATSPVPSRPTGWTVRISRDTDIASLKPAHLKALIVIERLCGDRSYCWPTVQTLARLCGCKPSGGFRRMLNDMERAGLIARRPIASGPGAGYLGIYLRARLDRDRPVDEAPAPADQGVLLAPPMPDVQPTYTHASDGAADLPQMGQPGVPQMGQQKDEVLEEESKNDDVVEIPDVVEKDPEDIKTLTSRAEERFGAHHARRVEDACAAYGIDAVAAVLFTCQNLKSWGGVLGTLKNWSSEGIPDRALEQGRKALDRPRQEATRDAQERSAKQAALEADRAERERQERLEALWRRLCDDERAAIMSEVASENPALRRWPVLMQPLYLAALERRAN